MPGKTLSPLLELPAVAPHPARYSAELYVPLARACGQPRRLLDPFAGTGRIHHIGALCDAGFVVGGELEPEWAVQSPGPIIVGNALHLPFPDEGTFDVVCTSPTYGNRMADHHDARDPSRRRTYKHMLGRDPHPASSAVLQWGADYRAFHEQAWREALRVLEPDGRFVLNVKNHVRAGELVDVVGWHIATLRGLGATVTEAAQVATPSYGNGANAEAREHVEHIVTFSNRPGGR